MAVANIKVRAHGRHVECHLAGHVRTVDEHHHAVLVTQGRELKRHGPNSYENSSSCNVHEQTTTNNSNSNHTS